MFKPKNILFSFLLLFVTFVTTTQVSYAQNSVAGIGLTPALTEDSAMPGDVKTFPVSVTNLSKVNQVYYIYKKDISSVKEGGVPVFADETLEKTGYELTDWVTTDVDQIDLAPGESKPIVVTLTVPANAAPGSHFGAVIVSMQPPRMRQTGAAVGYEVAHVISIRVAGDAVESAQIRAFATGDFIYGKSKVDFNAKVENKGNTLIRPVGPLEIYNMFGKRVAILTFNDSKAGIFPKAIRDFTLTWENENPGFGRYEAVLSLVYGSDGQQSTISSTASFWILPMNIILPALGAFVVVVIVAIVSIKLYVNKSIRIASGSTRRIVRRRKSSGISALLLVVVVVLAISALFLVVLLALFA